MRFGILNKKTPPYIYIYIYMTVSRFIPPVNKVINVCSPSHVDFLSDLAYYDQQFLYIYIYTYISLIRYDIKAERLIEQNIKSNIK